MARDAISLWFQPIVCLRTLEVRSFEGLARGRDQQGRLVSPSAFIPTVEADPDLYQAFTDRMIGQAIAFAVRCQEANQTPQITVNLAEASLRDTGFADRVDAALRHAEIPARQLMFEITEREFIDPKSAQLKVLERLSELGVGVTIDDFGTGWSSLDTLRWLPLSQLKIDRGFVDHIAHHAADRIIVEKVIELAHSLHLLVVAEGIETAEQLDILREVGCDRGQGFLFSPAVEPEDAVALAVAGFVEEGPAPPTAQAPAIPGGCCTSFTIDSPTECIGEVIADATMFGQLGLQVLEVLPQPVFVKANDGRIMWSNEAYWRRVGASSLDEILELRDIDIHQIDEALRYRYDDLVVVATGEAKLERDEFQTRPDGSRLRLRTSKFPIRNNTGAVIGLIGFYVELGNSGDTNGPLHWVSPHEASAPR